MKKNVAVILAGGVGSRLGLSTPKQFFKVAGKMVVEHTIDTFESNPHIHEIAIVSNPFYISDFEWMEEGQEDIERRTRTVSFQPIRHQSLRRH